MILTFTDFLVKPYPTEKRRRKLMNTGSAELTFINRFHVIDYLVSASTRY